MELDTATSGTGEDEVTFTEEGSLSSEAHELDELLEGSDDDIFKDLGIDPNKYGINKEEEKLEGKSETDEAQAAPDKQGLAIDDTAIIEKLNALNLVHNENPFKVESLDEAKNLIQMGRDYSAKTQALSAERKDWEANAVQAETEFKAAIEEFNSQRSQLENDYTEMQQFRFALDRMKLEDPDIFEAVQRHYQQAGHHFNNPVVNQRLKAMQSELAETKKALSQRESKLIVDEYETEKKGMAATEQSLKELGINVDWNAVKKEWTETGLPLSKVVGSMYFDSVAKAQASKSKVEATKAKVVAKPNASAASARVGQTAPKIKNNGDYLAMARELYNNMR